MRAIAATIESKTKSDKTKVSMTALIARIDDTAGTARLIAEASSEYSGSTSGI